MEEIILFVITFILVYIFYQIFIIKTATRRNSKRKPPEINYLIYRYKLDIKKVNYKSLLNIVSTVSSFDISLTVSLVSLSNSFLIEILVAIISVIITFLVSYHLVGIYYKKKGCIENV